MVASCINVYEVFLSFLKIKMKQLKLLKALKKTFSGCRKDWVEFCIKNKHDILFLKEEIQSAQSINNFEYLLWLICGLWVIEEKWIITLRRI